MAAPRRSEHEAREELLDAGRRLLVRHYRSAPEQLHDGLRGVLTAQAVAAEAGYGSHAVLYRLWGRCGDALAEFTAEVVASMTSVDHGSQVLIEAAVALRRAEVSWEEALRLMAEAELVRLSDRDRERWTAWLGLAPYAFAQPLRQAWQEAAELADARSSLHLFYATALTLWHKRMRPGLTEADLQRALTAALDGFVLDHRLNDDGFAPLDDVRPTPEGGLWTRWTLAARGIFEVFTEDAAV